MNSEALIKRTTKIMYGDEGVSGTAQYISQLVWILFLKVFDYKEEEWELEDNYVPVIPAPFRFRDWADPKNADGSKDYKNRLTAEKLIDFVNMKLFPFLRGTEVEINGNKYTFVSDDPKALIVREFMGESSNYMKDGVNLRQVVDEIAEIDFDNVGEKHEFNEFYEKLLKELQNGGKATGEFYTPRAVTKFITDHVDPKIGERVADFACGTAGFLAEAVSHMQKQATTIEDNDTIQKSVYGIEWKQLPYMLAITNMLLHNLDNPRIIHGNGLAKNVLDLSDEDMFDCVLMNPPFGGVVKESDKANFPNDLVSGESADLFVARIIYCLKKNGRCGLVLPDGLLFNNDPSKVALKKKLLTECNLHTIIRLPSSVFAPYTPITTNLLFFDKTKSTEYVWYYRMDMPEGRKHFNKTHPIKREDMAVIDEWWDNRVEIKDEKEDESMTETWKAKRYSIEELEANGFDMNMCGYPEKEEIILTPEETIKNYMERKKALELKLSVSTSALKDFLDGKLEANLGDIKNVSEMISNLDKDFPSQMKKAILQYAMQGKLTEQLNSDSSVEELLLRISERKSEMLRKGIIKAGKPLPSITENDIPFDIPDTWKWVRWGEIAYSIQYGYNAPALTNGRIKMVRISDIQNNNVIWETVPFCDIKDDEIETYLLKENDILFARTGGTVGKSFLVKNIVEESIYAGYLIRTRYDEELIPQYLKYFMESQLYWVQLQNGKTKGCQPNCNGQTLAKMMLPIPPVEEQQRIVEKLCKIIPLIDD